LDTVKMHAVLKKYKEILGNGCDSCISQADEALISKVTGKMHSLDNLGFLLNVINHIENEGKFVEENNETNNVDRIEKDEISNGLYEQWYYEAKAENARLVASNNELLDKVKSMESLIGTYNKCYVQQAKLKTGEKIAYKEQASWEEVNKLKMAGLTNDQIANKLGVSRSTIWRRLKEGV